MQAQRFTRIALAAATVALSACSQLGNVGDVLGSVLGTGQSQAQVVSAAVANVDTRNQQLQLQQSNGSYVTVAYDANTKVMYNNQTYTVANLERGDQVNARVQALQNGGYYTDAIEVTQSVSTAGGVSGGGVYNGNVQSVSGYVYQIDRTNGWFTLQNGGSTVQVTMPYNASSADVRTFNNLRSGDSVRFYGVWVSNNRVELRQFY